MLKKSYIQCECPHVILYIMCVLLCNRSGTPRPPFDDLIQRLACLQNGDQTPRTSPFIVSIDIPSGWHVDEGDINGAGIKPDMLVGF